MAGQVVQSRLIGALVAFGLLAEITRPDAVHQQDGGGDDGPRDKKGTAGKRQQLRMRLEPDEPGVIVGFQKDASFRKVVFQ